jgi:hypothetical protein
MGEAIPITTLHLVRPFAKTFAIIRDVVFPIRRDAFSTIPRLRPDMDRGRRYSVR